MVRSRIKQNNGYKTWFAIVDDERKLKKVVRNWLKYFNEPVDAFVFDGYSHRDYGQLLNIRELELN